MKQVRVQKPVRPRPKPDALGPLDWKAEQKP